MIGCYDTELEALGEVRWHFAHRWTSDELSLGPELSESEDGDDADLPPAFHGAELATRIQALDPEQAPLSA